MMASAVGLDNFLKKFLEMPAKHIAFKNWNDQSREFDQISYGDLHGLIARIKSLFDPYTTRQTKVMVIGPKGYFSTASILATWLGHGFYMPCSPSAPLHKIGKMIEVFDPDFLLVEDLDAALLKALQLYAPDKRIIVYNQPQISFAGKLNNLTLISELSPTPLYSTTRPKDSVAYVMTTSGTTGGPKFIAIRDSNLSSYYENVMSLLPTTECHGILQNFEPTFDPFIADILWCFSKGAYLIPLTQANIRDLSLILKEETHLWWTSSPSYADWVVQVASPLTPHPDCITESFFLGERLFPTTCQSWHKSFKKSRVHNLYGPTEATISISYHTYSGDVDCHGPVPIGNIHKSHDFKINDKKELLLSGSQVIENYFDQTINSKSFSQDSNGQHWYNTGDLCEIRNGKLVIFGRADLQIKVHGQRFEIDEIENFLRSRGCEVILFPVMGEDETVDHIAVATSDESLKIEALHQLIKDDFQFIFFPKSILYLKEMPLNENHKIDRKKLSELAKTLLVQKGT